MFRSACLRALALATATLVGPAVLSAGARQSTPGSNPVQPPATAPQTPPPAGTMPQTNPGSPATQGSVTATPGPVVMQKTPAEQRYGLPRNPQVGGPVDLDLNKPLTLDRAIAIALQQQNAIAIARTQTDIANAQLTQARASYFPQITPGFTFQTNLAPFFNSQIGHVVPSRSETRSDAIVARQLIWDTGIREANVGLSRRNVFAAQYGLGDERQAVILNVTQNFYTLMQDIELVRVQTESVRRAQTTLDAIQAQVNVGKAAAVDTFQAQSDLANAQVALLQAENNRDLSQASLKNAMGVVTTQPLLLANQTLAPPDTKPDTTPLDQYVRLAYADRLDVKQQQERVNAAGYSLRIARINNGVTVNADVTEGYQLDPSAGEERLFTVGVSYPLFDAGSTRAAVRSSKAALEQQQRTLDQLEQNVHLEVEQAFVTREQARQRIVAAQAAVTAGQANYNAALGKQQFGQGTVLDVINAEVLLVTAQVSLVQATYDFYTADAQLTRAIGANDPAYAPNLPAVRSRRTPPAVTARSNTASPRTTESSTLPSPEGAAAVEPAGGGGKRP